MLWNAVIMVINVVNLLRNLSTCNFYAQWHCQSGYNSERVGTANCGVDSGVLLQLRISPGRIDKFFLPKRWDLE